MPRFSFLKSSSLSTGILICCLGLLWAAGIVCAKISMNHGFPPLLFATVEAIGIACVSTVIACVARSPFSVNREYIRYWCVTGATMVVIPYLFTYIALEHLGASRASVLQSLTAVFTALIAITLRTERVSVVRAGGILLSLGGVTMLIIPGNDNHASSSGGLWLLVGLIAPLSYAVSNSFAHKVSPPGLDVPAKARGSNIFAAGVLTLLVILQQLTAPPEGRLDITATGFLVAAVAVTFNAGASLLFFYLASSRGAVNASAASYMTTASGVLLGVIFLHEPFTWLLLVALVITLLGVFLVAKRAAHRGSGEKSPTQEERETDSVK